MGLVAPQHVGSSRTRARTRVLCIGRQIPNHCATREARELFFLTSLLEYNCFTVVCQVLLYNKVNQLYIYICPHISSLFFFLNLFILFIYFWLRWVFVAAYGLSLVAASSGYSSLRWAGFSLWWLLLLWSTGSRRAGFSSCGSRAVERRLSSCGTWA